MESKIDETRMHVAGLDIFTRTPGKYTVSQAARSQLGQEVTRQSPSCKEDDDRLVLHLEEGEVDKLTTLVANEQLTWDESVWALAEIGLIVGSALRIPHGKWWWGALPEEVTTIPARLDNEVDLEEVRDQAHTIAQDRPTLQELQKFLAQRLYLAHFLQDQVEC